MFCSYKRQKIRTQIWIGLHFYSLMRNRGFLADPGFFFHRIASKWLANILLNINSGVLGVLLIIFFGDPICVQPTKGRLFWIGCLSSRVIGSLHYKEKIILGDGRMLPLVLSSSSTLTPNTNLLHTENNCLPFKESLMELSDPDEHTDAVATFKPREQVRIHKIICSPSSFLPVSDRRTDRPTDGHTLL